MYFKRSIMWVSLIILIFLLVGCSSEDTYLLETITEGNGNILRTPNQEDYENNTKVTLEAKGEEGYAFAFWEGHTGEEDENPIDVIIRDDTFIKAVFKESDKYFSTAKEIVEREEYEGVLQDIHNDSNYYKFKAEGNDITINFDHKAKGSSNSNFDIYLYNANEDEMVQYQSENGIDSTIQTGVEPGEEYYLRISGRGSGDVDYKFSIEFGDDDRFEIEPNGSFARAEKIDAGEEKRGSTYAMYNRYSNDYYKFKAEGNDITINFDHKAKGSSNSNFDIYLYNANEDERVQYQSENGIDSTIQTGVELGEEYYLRISGRGSGDVDYKFSIEFD